MFHALNFNDGAEDLRPLHVNLTIQDKFSARLNALNRAAKEQKGLSEIDFVQALESGDDESYDEQQGVETGSGNDGSDDETSFEEQDDGQVDELGDEAGDSERNGDEDGTNTGANAAADEDSPQQVEIHEIGYDDGTNGDEDDSHFEGFKPFEDDSYQVEDYAPHGLLDDNGGSGNVEDGAIIAADEQGAVEEDQSSHSAEHPLPDLDDQDGEFASLINQEGEFYEDGEFETEALEDHSTGSATLQGDENNKEDVEDNHAIDSTGADGAIHGASLQEVAHQDDPLGETALNAHDNNIDWDIHEDEPGVANEAGAVNGSDAHLNAPLAQDDSWTNYDHELEEATTQDHDLNDDPLTVTAEPESMAKDLLDEDVITYDDLDESEPPVPAMTSKALPPLPIPEPIKTAGSASPTSQKRARGAGEDVLDNDVKRIRTD